MSEESGTATPHQMHDRTQRPEGRLNSSIAHFVFVVGLLMIIAMDPTAALCTTVGFERVSIPQTDGPPLEGAFWYPSSTPEKLMTVGFAQQRVAVDGAIAGRQFPLVVFSHGALGSWEGNLDTAVALARAGIVSAALTYDRSPHDDVMKIANHGSQLSALISFALHGWRGHTAIDPNKIGAFGFSLGAFTVLTVAGGRPDLNRIAPHCRLAASEWSCAVARGHLDIAEDPPPIINWVRDPRIKAVVIAAPALGYLFGKQGLKDVTMPVQLWQASPDFSQRVF